MGDQDRAIEYGHQALTIADAVDEFTLRLRANTYLGQTYYALGDYRRAAGFLVRNVDILDNERMLRHYGFAQLPSVHSRTCLVWCLAELGEFEEGVRIGRDAIRIAESVDHPFTLATAHAGIGVLYVRQGNLDPHDAEALQLELRRLAKRYGRIKDLQIETTTTKPDGRSA